MKKTDLIRIPFLFTFTAIILSFSLTSCNSLKETSEMPLNGDFNLAKMNPKMDKKGNVYKTNAIKVYEDIHYATVSNSEVCDIYIPESTEKTPVLILVHGGGFAFESNRMTLMESVAIKAVKKGYAVVAVDYRKSGEAAFPGALSDVKAAVRYVKANAALYNLDDEKIVIWGESAGAYLSLMTSLTPQVKELDGDVKDNSDYSSAVNVLVDFYGPVEFYTMDNEYKSLGIENTKYSTENSFESRFLGQAVGKDKSKTYTTYWENYLSFLPSAFNLKAWIQAGTSDNNVPYTQSKNFGERLSNLIGSNNVHYSFIEGAAHMDSTFYTDENLEEIFTYIGY